MANLTSEGMIRPELWPSSGFGLLERDADGRLVVTDGFLGAYLAIGRGKGPGHNL